MIIAIHFLYLPLKGGGRSAKRSGWGSVAQIDPTPLAVASLRRATLPFQGRDEK
jgi:hypothetical protein